MTRLQAVALTFCLLGSICLAVLGLQHGPLAMNRTFERIVSHQVNVLLLALGLLLFLAGLVLAFIGG